MYVMLIFALALLSPLPFVSPFASVMQDATAQSQFSSFDVDPTSSTVQPLAGPVCSSNRRFLKQSQYTDIIILLVFVLCPYLNMRAQYMH